MNVQGIASGIEALGTIDPIETHYFHFTIASIHWNEESSQET